MTGPWVLALGTLAIGAGAVAVRFLRRRSGDDSGRTRPDDPDVEGAQRTRGS